MLKNRNNSKRLLVITALSLLVAFILTATVAQAWNRTAWVSFNVRNNTGYTCNRIIGGGITLFKVTKCLKGDSPKFPNCWTGSKYIGRWGIGWLTGFYFGDRTTNPGVTRKIGFGRKWCCAIVGAGVWLESGTNPRGWFPLVGWKCKSPVSFVVDDSLRQPFTVTDVEYGLRGDPIPFDSLDYDNPLPWQSTSLQNMLVYPGDSIPIPDLPPEDIVLDSVLFLRGHLVAEIDTGGGTYVDTVDFAVEILEEEEEKEFPVLTHWGLIILAVLVVSSGIWLMLRKRRAVRA